MQSTVKHTQKIYAPFDQPGELMLKTKELLKNRNLFDVSVETGVPFYWLRKFFYGQFANPSVNRVDYLYRELSGNTYLSTK